MKKGVLFLVFLLIIPSAWAVANLDVPDKAIYNLGDSITINGYILETQDTWGLLRLDLFCGNNVPVFARTLSIKADEKTEFKETLPIPHGITGDCKIILSFESNGKIIEQVDSDSFVITKDLKGSFGLEENLVQVGKDVKITGSITRQDGSEVDGFATVYFKQDGVDYLVENVDVENGQFEYKHDTIANPPGEYNIKIIITDIYGNEGNFDLERISLVNEIYVFVQTGKERVLPGSSVSVYGEAKTVLQEKIGKAEVYVSLDNQSSEKTSLRAGQYSYGLKIANDIKTGDHQIDVVVEDEYGNIGRTNIKIIVEAIPTTLEANVINGVLKPEESLKVIPSLYDQAGDLMSESIKVQVFDVNGDLISEGVSASGEEIEFKLPKFSKPGDWLVKVMATGLKSEKGIQVGELSALDFRMDNSTLVITNVGNIKTKEEVVVEIKGLGETSQIIKDVSLGPSKSLKINLNWELPTGTYDIFVGSSEFKDVKVVSQRRMFRFDYLYWILIGGFVALLVYLILFRKKILKKKIVGKLKKKKMVKSEGMLKADTQEDAKKKYANAFREMALKAISKREGKVKKLKIKKSKEFKKSKDSYVKLGKKEAYKPEKKDKGGGLFNMFGGS